MARGNETQQMDTNVQKLSYVKKHCIPPTEGVWQYGAEENIWTEEGRGNGGMEETA